MGKPKFSRKKYETPSHPWQEDRIKEENELIKKYGLKNKKEIWKAQTRLRKYRGQARELLAKVGRGDIQSKKESEQLLMHLNTISILPMNSTLDDVLALGTESILSRRLQTLTYLKGLANTPDQARQLISHGHIAIGSRKVTVPGYMVNKQEEGEIGYIHDSPLNDVMHPARPRAEFPTTRKAPITIKPKEEKSIEQKPPIKEKSIKHTPPVSEPSAKEPESTPNIKSSKDIKKDIKEKQVEKSENKEIKEKPIDEPKKEELKKDEKLVKESDTKTEIKNHSEEKKQQKNDDKEKKEGEQ